MAFCLESGWVKANAAAKLKPNKITSGPTLPFSRDEVQRVVLACADEQDAVRLNALVLLLRYSGLRLGDATTSLRDRVEGDRLGLYTAKTGTHIYCPLHKDAVAALNAIPQNGPYFFWTGNSTTKSTNGNWQRALKRVFKRARVPTGHAHRFRDTFAGELLLAGVPLERVGIMLGHQSVRVTERHYSPWVRERQVQIEEDIRRSWGTKSREPRPRNPRKHGHAVGTEEKW